MAGRRPLHFAAKDPSTAATKDLLRQLPRRALLDLPPGELLYVLVLGCTPEDTTGIDLTTRPTSPPSTSSRHRSPRSPTPTTSPSRRP